LYTGLARAEDWYAITSKNSCAKASTIAFATADVNLFGYPINSPTDVIKAYREERVPYVIDEKTKNGKVVEVTITNKKNYHRITLYRLEHCQEVARSIQRKEAGELERYK
jgi:hypothetical protein